MTDTLSIPATTGKEKVLSALRSITGRRWIAADLADACGIQINTCEKWICILRKEGHGIESAPVPGKTHYEYWYSAGPLAPVVGRCDHQADAPCPACGSWYRDKEEKCNRCGKI